VGRREFTWAVAAILLVAGLAAGLASAPPLHFGDSPAPLEAGRPAAVPSWTSDSTGLRGDPAASEGPTSEIRPLEVAPRATGIANATPPGSPNITRIVPGSGQISVEWIPPFGNQTITSYLLEWGFEGGVQGNQTAAAANRSAEIVGLIAFAHYHVNVTAFNGTVAGPPSVSVSFVLYGWTIVAGAVSPSDATVWVDSVPVPVVDGAYSDNTSLVPHELTASATDYRTGNLVALPVWNGTSWGNFTLALLPGTIEGYVAPVTCLVTWNATTELVNANGLFSFEVPPATPGALVVSYPGLVTWEQTISVPANVTDWQNVTLAAPNATLTLHVRPETAALSVDGAPVPTDASGNATVSLAAGTHRLEATHADYYAYFANVTLTSGQVETLGLNLTEIANSSGPNGTVGSASPFSDPIVLGLLVGVALLAVVIIVLGRRGRALNAPRPRGPDEYGTEDIDAVELPTEPGPPAT
jgi:fibronectin type III domain protein